MAGSFPSLVHISTLGVFIVVSAEGTLGVVPRQFPQKRPLIIAWFRHPVLRTVSQVRLWDTCRPETSVFVSRHRVWSHSFMSFQASMSRDLLNTIFISNTTLRRVE